ncbi:outer membrane beta-barrel protein [Psychroserpens sp. XS_ASV72]|uniref:outer membrane beta-barrel protein n=1 Tax=Psychroserpens sp. XS_ASV72 TaxID=3241293 RepID=UPI0035121917
MKKLLLFAAVAVFGLTSVVAQDGDDGNGNDKFTGGYEQGDIILSGAVGFSSTSQDDNSSSAFTIMPSVLYMFNPNWSVGASVGYMSNKAESGDVDTIDNNTISLLGHATYYFNPEHRFVPWVGAGAGYETTSYNLESDDYKVNGFTVGAFAGATFWMSDCFAIFAQMGILSYSSLKPDFDGAESINSFGLNVDFKELSIGAKFRL